jgi:hypothetical protein
MSDDVPAYGLYAAKTTPQRKECYTTTLRRIIMRNEHRLGVSKVNLVFRHLKLEPSNQQDLHSAIAEIDHLYGLDKVSFDASKRMLNLAYDASRLCIEGIEKILARNSVEISHGWWNRFKEEHYRFVDQNIKDNAAKEPWSCH